MEELLIAQMTQSNILDPLINFEIVLANTEKEGKIKYAKKHKISKHYAFLAAFRLEYYFDQKDVWSICNHRESTAETFKLTYKKLKELNLKVTNCSEEFYKSHTI